jgi:hypothetical protein
VGPVACCFVNCNEPSGSTTDRKFLDQLRNYQLLKKDIASVNKVGRTVRLFFSYSRLQQQMGMSGQLYPPAVLPCGKELLMFSQQEEVRMGQIRNAYKILVD